MRVKVSIQHFKRSEEGLGGAQNTLYYKQGNQRLNCVILLVVEQYKGVQGSIRDSSWRQAADLIEVYVQTDGVTYIW